MAIRPATSQRRAASLSAGFTARLRGAWAALTGKPTGQRADPYAGTFDTGHAAGFAGGAVGRLTASLANWSGSVNADLDVALPILRARARSLAANNEHGKRFQSLVGSNVVGRRNPRLQVRALRPGAPGKAPELDKTANDTIEMHWERWGRVADLAGHHKSLYSLFRTAVKAVARDGEALIRVVTNRSYSYGLRLQLLEADRLDDALNQRMDNGNMIRQGVEIDTTGRAVAYWIKTAHPGEAYAVSLANRERVPASEMIHLFLPERAEQVRGVTWYHAVIVRGSIIHNFEEAAVVAAQIGASKIATLEASADANTGGGDDVANSLGDRKVGGIPQISAASGEILDLTAFPGVKLGSWSPEYPHQNFESFLKACLRGLAAGLDVAAHNLTGDMTDVNYSSARIAELSEREAWMILQDWFIDNFVMVVYERWLATALIMGAITFEDSGKALPADKFDKFFNASRFQGRRWAWVDPKNEADANEKNLQNKLTSRTRLAAEQGEEFEDLVDELKQEKDYMKTAGLTPPPPAQPGIDPAVKKQLDAFRSKLDMLLQLTRAAPAAPAAAPPVIHNNTHIHPGPVDARSTVNVQPPAAPNVQVDNHLTLEPTPVTLEATINNPEVRVENTVEVAAAEIRQVEITAMPDRVTTSDIERDSNGNIIATTQTEKDA